MSNIVVNRKRSAFERLYNCCTRGEGLDSVTNVTFEGGDANGDADIGGVKNGGTNRVMFADPHPVGGVDRVPFYCSALSSFSGHVVCCRDDEKYPFSYDCYLSSISGALHFESARVIGERLGFFVSRGIPRVGFISEAFGYGRTRTVRL